jgi:hypothetical protein
LLTLKGHKGEIHSVAFSPDGKRLASGDDAGTLKVWDAASGQELLSSQGHKGQVLSVAFSPDGKRLASAGGGALRLWDAASGQEVLTLEGLHFPVYSVAFSPDGKRLASLASGTVKMWNAASGQELLTLTGETDLVYSVAFSPDGRRLATTDDGAVVKVLETAVSTEDLRHREIVRLVRGWFEQLALRSEVVARLREDPMLDASERAFALQVAQTHPEDSGQLNAAAWEAVKVLGRGRDAYALALRQVQAAVQVEPDNGYYLNTLGVAQHRMGEYAKAVETLSRSEKLNVTKDGSHPADLAFLAMAQHQLGQKEQAQKTLRRLHEAMKHPPWVNNVEYHGFLREAEQLLQAKGSDPKK